MKHIKFNEKTCPAGPFSLVNLPTVSNNVLVQRTQTIPNINTLATKMNQIKFNKRTCPTVQFSLLNLHPHKKNIHLVTKRSSNGVPNHRIYILLNVL